MGKTTIEWTATVDADGTARPGFTFNPWLGCTKVSPACDHCYAETLATARLGVQWGPHAERRRTAASTWRQPHAWNRKAAREGQRYRVFCASLADVFDNAASEDWRIDLWWMIRATPHLDWLLLTKRPQNIAKMVPQVVDFGRDAWANGPWSNVWLGTTVENQAEADRRIPHLLAVPAAKRFLSMEPLLGPVDVKRWLFPRTVFGASPLQDRTDHTRLDWIIAGGESGPRARPSHPDWFRSLRDQCQAAGVPFFFKQWGEWGPIDAERRTEPHAIANDGTLYAMRDLAHPDGARRGEAIRAGHDKAHLCTTYRVGKKPAGAELDGREWREVPA